MKGLGLALKALGLMQYLDSSRTQTMKFTPRVSDVGVGSLKVGVLFLVHAKGPYVWKCPNHFCVNRGICAVPLTLLWNTDPQTLSLNLRIWGLPKLEGPKYGL